MSRVNLCNYTVKYCFPTNIIGKNVLKAEVHKIMGKGEDTKLVAYYTYDEENNMPAITYVDKQTRDMFTDDINRYNIKNHTDETTLSFIYIIFDYLEAMQRVAKLKKEGYEGVLLGFEDKNVICESIPVEDSKCPEFDYWKKVRLNNNYLFLNNSKYLCIN